MILENENKAIFYTYEQIIENILKNSDHYMAYFIENQLSRLNSFLIKSLLSLRSFKKTFQINSAFKRNIHLKRCNFSIK